MLTQCYQSEWLPFYITIAKRFNFFLGHYILILKMLLLGEIWLLVKYTLYFHEQQSSSEVKARFGNVYFDILKILTDI